MVRILQTCLLGVSSNWRVFIILCETFEHVGEERGEKEERVRGGGGGGGGGGLRNQNFCDPGRVWSLG